VPGSPSFPPRLLERRTMRVLVVAQLLGACGLAAGGTAGGLLAEQLTGSPATAGMPLSLLVLGSGVGVGAVAGPNLLGPAGALAGVVGLPAPTGLFLLAIPAFLGAALVLVVFLRPDPLQVARAAAPSTQQPAVAGGKRALASLLGDRHIRLALVVLAVANLSMVGVMAVAPVHLHDHGAGMGTIGLLISAHIAAMYLPSRR
jgi:MFS family permease